MSESSTTKYKLATGFKRLPEGVEKGFRNDLRIFKDIFRREKEEEAARDLVNRQGRRHEAGQSKGVFFRGAIAQYERVSI